MRALRASAVRWLGAVALGGGLLAGGVWFAVHHNLADGIHPPAGVLAAAPTGAFAQEATPAPSPVPARANSAPARTNSPRPTGQVTQIVTTSPASFTIQTANGAQMTFRVLDSTVFTAGRDRPYHFDLLKQGDTVVVRGGPQPGSQAQAAPGQPTQAKPARVARQNPTQD